MSRFVASTANAANKLLGAGADSLEVFRPSSPTAVYYWAGAALMVVGGYWYITYGAYEAKLSVVTKTKIAQHADVVAAHISKRQKPAPALDISSWKELSLPHRGKPQVQTANLVATERDKHLVLLMQRGFQRDVMKTRTGRLEAANALREMSPELTEGMSTSDIVRHMEANV